MLTEVLEAFEEGLDHAETSDAYQKVARKLVGQIDALTASVDALPDELRPTLPTADEIAALRAIVAPAFSPELQSLKAKVEAAITLGPDAGLVDFDADKAKELVERYSKLMTSFGGRKSGTGGKNATGIRSLTHPMRLTCGTKNPRVSGSRGGGGDWTWIRWQITDDAKEHDGVAKESLDALRVKVQAVENGEMDSVTETIVAGDGTEYVVEYPALV